MGTSLCIVLLIGLSFIRKDVQKTQSLAATPPKNFPAIVLPHHDLVLEEFPDFYKHIVDNNQINKIIILSPNHFETTSTVVKLRLSNFSINQKIVPVESNNISGLEFVEIDDQVFEKEHGVFIHLPFIAQYFPDVPITALLLTRAINQDDLDKLIVALRSNIDESTLLLVSTDFSHGLDYSSAEEKDVQTEKLVMQGNADSILALNDEYTDCSACLYVLLRLQSTARYVQPEKMFHGNSAQYVPLNSEQITTSYFVFTW